MTYDYSAVARGDFLNELRKLGADFPNHGAWDVSLPAGHWRALADLLSSLPTTDAVQGAGGELERLRALSEAAAPGEWCVENPFDGETEGDLSIVQAGLETYDWQFLAHCPFGGEEAAIPKAQVEANAAFIVASVNYVRALLSPTPSRDEELG